MMCSVLIAKLLFKHLRFILSKGARGCTHCMSHSTYRVVDAKTFIPQLASMSCSFENKFKLHPRGVKKHGLDTE